MKKLLILLLFPICVLGQEKYHSYAELNSGIAVDWEKKIHPTLSTVFGFTFDMGDYILVDIQAGLSKPSVITGKIGVGSYFGKKEKISLVIGCRIYPLMFYSQLNFGAVDKFQFTMCGEIGGGGPKSLDFRSMFNAGFRWPVNTKQR